MIFKFMKALGSQPLQYYKLEFTVTETVAITGKCAHLEVDSNHYHNSSRFFFVWIFWCLFRFKRLCKDLLQ